MVTYIHFTWSPMYPFICVRFPSLNITVVNFSPSLWFSISCSASLLHTLLSSLSPISHSVPSHTLCWHTNDFPGMRMRLKSGPRLFCPLQTTNERVKSDACEQPGRMAHWGTLRDQEREWERVRQRQKKREASWRDPICHCCSRLQLDIVARSRTRGGTGGTLTN